MKQYEFENIMSGTTKLENAKTEEEIELAVIEFEKACYIPFYNNLILGFIYPSEEIFDSLEFFERIGDNEKAENCANMLNKYYTGFLSNKFQELILDEKYELCNRMKKFVI